MVPINLANTLIGLSEVMELVVQHVWKSPVGDHLFDLFGCVGVPSAGDSKKLVGTLWLHKKTQIKKILFGDMEPLLTSI